MFERVVVINLAAERWERFVARLPSDWPFAEPVRFEAIDGLTVPMRTHWRKSAKHWGCFLSHMAIMEQAVADGIDSVLVLEDDAVFCEGFAEHAAAFAGGVPNDWEQIYLGGQHVNTTRHRNVIVNDRVITIGNVNRTHAHAMRHEYMKMAREYMMGNAYNLTVDYQFGRLHASHKVYAPWRWLVGQIPDGTDDADRVLWWNTPLHVYREGERKPITILNVGRQNERPERTNQSSKRPGHSGSSNAGMGRGKRGIVCSRAVRKGTRSPKKPSL